MKYLVLILCFVALISVIKARHPIVCGCPPDEPVCDTNGKKWASLCHLECLNHEPVEHDVEEKCLKTNSEGNAYWANSKILVSI